MPAEEVHYGWYENTKDVMSEQAAVFKYVCHRAAPCCFSRWNFLRREKKWKKIKSEDDSHCKYTWLLDRTRTKTKVYWYGRNECRITWVRNDMEVQWKKNPNTPCAFDYLEKKTVNVKSMNHSTFILSWGKLLKWHTAPYLNRLICSQNLVIHFLLFWFKLGNAVGA